MVVQAYEVANCLTARMHKGINTTVDEGQTPVIALQDVTAREKAQNGRGWNADGTAYTVDTHATQGVVIGTDCYNGSLTGDIAATMGTPGSSINASGPTVMVPIAWDEELNASIDQAGTLLRGGDGGRHDGVMVGGFKPGQSAAAGSIGYENEMAPSLEAGGGGNNKPAVHIGMQVRRLTPVECERLQGFPDNYTNIKDKCPDGPRYKALGNSWAVPVVRWIGKRIQEHINAP